jgi:hypothetical protein
MPDLTRQSDQIVREAGQSLAMQRAGGRRASIGKASAGMKARHFGRKIIHAVLAGVAILIGAGLFGTLTGGLGFEGVMLTAVALLISTVLLLRYPALKVPARADLSTPDVKKLVGKTELWLEAQRPALPPPAAKLLGGIGVQLDELQLQLEDVDQRHPTAAQIRKLVGEDLPEMIEGYQRIPERMRYEASATGTPARQLEEGLATIGQEIESINRQLAQGSLDDLAIRTRYLEYKYGESETTSPSNNS